MPDKHNIVSEDNKTSGEPRILLVSPPGTYVDMPALGIACLKGKLKAGGYSGTRVWDSNLDFLEYLLSPATLEKQESRIRDGVASGGDTELKLRSLFMLPFLRDRALQALDIFRDPATYYNAREFNRASSIVKLAVSSYGTEPDPLEYNFASQSLYIDVDRKRLPFSLSNLLAFSESDHSWPLMRGFFETYRARVFEEGAYDLVGFSCGNYDQFLSSLFLARLLRSSNIARNIVLGGSFLSSVRKVVCERKDIYSIFDYLVVFEGEDAICGLAKVVKGRATLDDVPNTSYLQGNEVRTTALKKIENVDLLPTPDFSGFPVHRYLTPEPVMPAYASRGCFYDVCEFCNHHENYFGKFRLRSTALVIRDLQVYEQQYGASKIFFVDELMTPKQRLEIALQITQLKMKTRWYCHGRVEKQFTEDHLNTLAKGGLTLLHVGMESANTRVLSLMKKGYDRERVIGFLEAIKNVPMTLHLNTIEAFPGEQPEEYLETLNTARRYARLGDYVHLYSFGFVTGALIGKNGNPYVKNVRADTSNDLDLDLLYETEGIRTYTELESKQRDICRGVLSDRIAVLNGIFPEQCVWASHLLYASHYREIGRHDLLDRPRESIEMPTALGQFVSSELDPERCRLIVSPGLRLAEVRVSGEQAWMALDETHFDPVQVSDVLADALKSDVNRLLGTISEDLRVELYRLVRAGIVAYEEKAA